MQPPEAAPRRARRLARQACGAISIGAMVVWMGGGQHAVHGQVDEGAWRTLAGGDEILVLKADPYVPTVLWAGTEGGGLVRWDLALGRHEQYLFPQQAGLTSNVIRDIAFDASGSPWLATDAGVVHAGGQTWAAYGLEAGLPTPDTLALVIGPDGSVWVGTRGEGVAELPAGAATFVSHYFDGDSLGRGVNTVVDLAISPEDGSLWAVHGRAGSGDQPAISVFSPATRQWQHLRATAPGGTGGGPPSDQILAIDFAPDGGLYAGTWSRGLAVYDGESWVSYTNTDGLCGRSVWAVTATAMGAWVACGETSGGTGVSELADGRFTTFTTADGLPTNVVTSLAVAGGVAYAGTNGPGVHGSGIVSMDRPDTVFTTFPETLASNDVTAIAFDGSGAAWVGTRGRGLLHQAAAGGWEHFTWASTQGGLVGDMITDMAWDGERLWVGTTKSVYQAGVGYLDGGVSAYDPAARTWTAVRADNAGLPDHDVSSVDVGPDGRVWIGIGMAAGEPGVDESLYRGNGIAVYDPVAGRVTETHTYAATGAGLPGDTVIELAVDGDVVWAAASYFLDNEARRRGGGAGRYQSGVWTGYVGGQAGFQSHHGSGIPTDQDPFITGDVRSIAAAGGRGWAGTWTLGSGSLSNVWPFVDAVVNTFEAGAWTSHTFRGSGWVSALAVDQAGRVWAGTSRGHEYSEYDPAGGARLDTAEGGVRLWDGGAWLTLTPANSGLASRSITAIAVHPDTGDVWLGTANGGVSIMYSGEVPATATAAWATITPSGPSPTPVTLPTLEPTSTPPAGGGAPLEPTPPGTDGPEPPREVPEPSTLILFGTGLAGLAAWRRRRAGLGPAATEDEEPGVGRKAV